MRGSGRLNPPRVTVDNPPTCSCNFWPCRAGIGAIPIAARLGDFWRRLPLMTQHSKLLGYLKVQENCCCNLLKNPTSTIHPLDRPLAVFLQLTHYLIGQVNCSCSSFDHIIAKEKLHEYSSIGRVPYR